VISILVISHLQRNEVAKQQFFIWRYQLPASLQVEQEHRFAKFSKLGKSQLLALNSLNFSNLKDFARSYSIKNYDNHIIYTNRLIHSNYVIGTQMTQTC